MPLVQAKSTMRKSKCIVICVCNDKPLAIQDDAGLKLFQDGVRAKKWLNSVFADHPLTSSAQKIFILNIVTGESEVYFD